MKAPTFNRKKSNFLFERVFSYACVRACEEHSISKKRNTQHVLSRIRTIIHVRNFFHLMQFLSDLLFLQNNRFGFVDLFGRAVAAAVFFSLVWYFSIATRNGLIEGKWTNHTNGNKISVWSLNARPLYVRACVRL